MVKEANRSLEDRVTERTAELATSNEDLKKVIGERELARWFGAGPGEGKLGKLLGNDAPAVHDFLRKRLADDPPARNTAVALVVGERG